MTALDNLLSGEDKENRRKKETQNEKARSNKKR